MYQVKEKLLKLQEEIAPYTPNIIAVTKYFGADGIVEAYQAGLRNFGESRIPESINKINSLPQEIRENSQFHLIGHLQTNKVKKAVENFDFIHSVDSKELAKKISEEACRQGKVQKIFLQVNNACEVQKFGFSKEELYRDFDEITTMKNLEVVGLMNIAPLTEDKETLKALFDEIRLIQKDLGLRELSMGMSNDYKEAVKTGATYIRIGRKLFS
ncbi:YggS family pyridoxal phosphate-dependent enzyme [bacterium]|nr:YggS family pyridoxal phosphate-dependent enzyme [bacterium]